MKRLLACLVACALLAVSAPALASPSMTHVNSACASSGSSATIAASTIAGGSLIVAGGNIRTSGSSDTITLSDTAGDTFTIHISPTSATIATFVGWAKTTGLSSGTVSLNTTGTWSSGCLSVEKVTGFNTTSPEDTGVLATAANTSNTPTVTSNAAAQSGDLLYSAFQYGNQTFTESTSPAWTNTQLDAGNSVGRSSMGYIINAGTAGVARNGSINSSAVWHGIVMGIAPTAAPITNTTCTIAATGGGTC